MRQWIGRGMPVYIVFGCVGGRNTQTHSLSSALQTAHPLHLLSFLSCLLPLCLPRCFLAPSALPSHQPFTESPAPSDKFTGANSRTVRPNLFACFSLLMKFELKRELSLYIAAHRHTETQKRYGPTTSWKLWSWSRCTSGWMWICVCMWETERERWEENKREVECSKE